MFFFSLLICVIVYVCFFCCFCYHLCGEIKYIYILLLLTFGLEFLQRRTCQRAADLESFGHDGWRDQLIARHLLVQLIICRFVEQNQVIELVAHFTLRPLLLVANQTRIHVLHRRTTIQFTVSTFWDFSAAFKILRVCTL